MPSKKSTTAKKPASKKGAKRKQDDVKAEGGDAEVKERDPADGPPNIFRRDQMVIADSVATDTDEPPNKAQKTSSSSPKAIIEWLLSSEAFDLAHPEIPAGKGEVDLPPSDTAKTPPPASAGQKAGSSPSSGSHEKGPKVDILRYPRSDLTPFQNLICACILSKPLSHKLGLRTIQTLFNPPFSIRTVKDLDEAGYEGRRKVMWEARTQHKEKTAAQLGDLITGLRDLTGASGYEGLDDLKSVNDSLKGSKDPEEAQKRVEKQLTTIKGIGPGVVAIFLRRIQGDWEEVYPFVDERSLIAAKDFGLVDKGDGNGAEDLKNAAAEDGGKGGGEEERKKFVRIVDVLVGLELEKKVEEAMKLAGL